MNQVFLVTITLDGSPIHRFVTAGTDDRAGYLAGACIDRLCDYHNKLFDYSVEPVPYASTMTAPIEVVKAALEADV